MRVFGGLSGRNEISCREERPQADAQTGERVHSSLLPIDHADGIPDDETGLAERRDRLGQRAARGDHVLDQADELARLEQALDPVAVP